VKIKELQKENYYNINNIYGNDVFNIIINFLDLNKKSSNDIQTKHSFTVDKFTLDNRTITGIIQYGDYGYRSTIRENSTSAITHRRVPTETEQIPLYFLINVPKCGDEFYLLFERFGHSSVRHHFFNKFHGYFRELFPKTILKQYDLFPSEVFKTYLKNGTPKELILTNFSSPPDISDRYSRSGEKQNIERSYSATLSVKAKRRGDIKFVIQPILDILNGKGTVHDFISVEGFNQDEASVEIVLDGKAKKFNIGKSWDCSPYYDITKDLVNDDDGHPKFDDIDHLSKEYLKDVLKGTGHQDD